MAAIIHHRVQEPRLGLPRRCASRMVGHGLASWALDGAESDLETKADIVEFALGRLTADEVIRRARYRLEA